MVSRTLGVLIEAEASGLIVIEPPLGTHGRRTARQPWALTEKSLRDNRIGLLPYLRAVSSKPNCVAPAPRVSVASLHRYVACAASAMHTA